MWSSSFFRWCPWIRDTGISYREPFGENNKKQQLQEIPTHWCSKVMVCR